MVSYTSDSKSNLVAPMNEKTGEAIALLYRAHLDRLTDRYDKALEDAGFDAAVIGAGIEITRFLDDQHYPFKPNSHLIEWLPLSAHPESCLIYQPGKPPHLIIYRPDDYWHQPPELPGPPWQAHFKIHTVSSLNDLCGYFSALPTRIAWIGDPAQWRKPPDQECINPPALMDTLHYYRPYKSAYEIECIRRATRRSVPAHRAAEAAFRQGATEHEILIAFLSAAGQTENELPYPAIIATNTHGAVLHYQHYDRVLSPPASLLIDAACSANGYAADITRTHAFDDQEFAQMIEALDRTQRSLCARVCPGMPFTELHEFAHRSIARLLHDWGLVRRDPDELFEHGITALFFPHGLGHYLGVQVHELGGTMADPSGMTIARNPRFPRLRLSRTLEEGQVLTIEPGIYFIDTLLAQLKESDVSRDIDWKRIDRLRQFGGIRIEDNIVVTKSGAENLTRRAFTSAS
jgi:Xaa-Pro dipeptidase